MLYRQYINSHIIFKRLAKGLDWVSADHTYHIVVNPMLRLKYPATFHEYMILIDLQKCI